MYTVNKFTCLILFVQFRNLFAEMQSKQHRCKRNIIPAMYQNILIDSKIPTIDKNILTRSMWGKPHKISDHKFILADYYFLMIDTYITIWAILGEHKLKSMKYIFLNINVQKNEKVY